MVETVKSLRRELDALAQTINELPGAFADPAIVATRIQDWFFTWSTLSSGLRIANVAPATVKQLDDQIAGLLRATSTRARKVIYLSAIATLRKILTTDLLLEIAKLPPAVRDVPQGQTQPARLLPEISDLPNDLIPNSLLGWVGGIKTFLKKNEFERNVFIMVAYRKRLDALIRAVQDCIRKKLSLNPILAKDFRLTDNLDNPIACLLCCKYGIAIFDKGDVRQQHNSNVVYELAVMRMLKRPCAILKHESLKTMPSDFLHQLYEPYKTPNTAVTRVSDWWKKIGTDGNANEQLI